MTIEQIKSSSKLRESLQKVVDGKEMTMVRTAIKMEIVRRIGFAPTPRVGQTFDGAVSNWHSFLHGMQTVVDIFETIGSEAANSMPKEEEKEKPFEHAIPPHLVEAERRGFKPAR